MYDMIIIGAGTAGLTAAVYGVRARRRVLEIGRAAGRGKVYPGG